MTDDRAVVPIRPADQSCLAHAQPAPDRHRAALTTTYIGQVRDVYVRAANPLTGVVHLVYVGERGSTMQVLQGLPAKLVGRFVAAFGDADTVRGGE